MNKYLIVLIFASLFSSLLFGQQFDFQKYDQDDGIQQPYIYDFAQTKDGVLWLATSGGIKLFNGLSISSIDTEQGLPNSFVKNINLLQNKIIGGHNSGDISILKNNQVLKLIDLPGKSASVAIKTENNNAYVLMQNGKLVEIDSNLNYKAYELSPLKSYKDFIFDKGKIIFATSEGVDIYKFHKDKCIYLETIENTEELEVETLIISKQKLYLGTVFSGLFYYENQTLHQVDIEGKLKNIHIKHITEHFGELFISTFGKGIFRIRLEPTLSKHILEKIYNKSNKLPSEFINKIYFDRERTMWIGSYGDGLIRLHKQAFETYNYKYSLDLKTHAYYKYDHSYLGGVGEVLVISGDETIIEKLNQTNGLPNVKITSILVNSANTIFVGTDNKGAYYKLSNENNFQKINTGIDELSNSINAIQQVNSRVFISTANGLFVLDKHNQLTETYNTVNGLPHNSINGVSNTREGIVILTSSSAIPVLKNKTFDYLKIPNEIGITELTGAEYNNKTLFFSTLGKGILIYKDNKWQVINKSSGLFSNYCYGIKADVTNKIWITHRAGISKFVPELNEITQYTENSFVGTNFSPLNILADSKSNLWFASTQRVIKYMPYLDEIPNIKPSVILNSVEVNNNEILNTEFLELPYDKHKITFNYSGISIRNPKEISFQFRLKGFDDSWSIPTTQKHKEYNQVYDGNYEFLVRSRMKSGEWSTPYSLLKIEIDKPIWKQWWFYLLVLTFIVAGVYFIIRYRTIQLKKQKIHLEKRLERRTAEITQQRNELATQNKDIQDSINYAKRIQDSLLSEARLLKASFDESFIFHKPKDVVSGDFYWFDQYDHRTVIICADATGHGVPGAFMSIIGSSMMKEIAIHPEVTTPSELVVQLDFQINDVLGQYGREGDTRDGMDLAILEIDKLQMAMTYCGALRPVLIVRDNEIIELKPDRHCVGGGSSELRKVFTDQYFKLEKNDRIYMYSDGYPDQFGGVKNKKLRDKVFKKMLLEHANLSMDQQRTKLSQFLKDWKGDNEQVDDILVIGIKV